MRSTRRAFTVVELLVVIAIIGVLMAILLPAVQVGREMARKTKCNAQIKQFAFAEEAHNTAKMYMSASRSFPVNQNISRPGNISTGSPANNPNAQSWVHPLLPHIERSDLYDQIENINTSGSNLGSLNLNMQGIAVVHCPSDISDVGVANPSRNSYAVNGGRVNGTPSGMLPLDWPANGVFDDRLKGTSDTFQIFRTSKADLSMGDGTTNTLMILENSDLMGWTRADNEYDVACVWGPAIPTNQLNKGRKPSGTQMSITYARPISYHSNGFNVAFCDGSVKFLADSIDYSVFSQLMTSNSAQLREPASNTATANGPYKTPLNANSY